MNLICDIDLYAEECILDYLYKKTAKYLCLCVNGFREYNMVFIFCEVVFEGFEIFSLVNFYDSFSPQKLLYIFQVV